MMKVMLVDDEPFIMQGLSVLIDWEALGYEIVKMASNGGEAYEYLKKENVDLVIADISMPVMSGLELLKRIREEDISDAYFVILSGYNDFNYAQQAIRYSCMDYLLKPIDKSQLTDILKRAAKEREEKLLEESRQGVRRGHLIDEALHALKDGQDKVVLFKDRMDELVSSIETG